MDKTTSQCSGSSSGKWCFQSADGRGQHLFYVNLEHSSKGAGVHGFSPSSKAKEGLTKHSSNPFSMSLEPLWETASFQSLSPFSQSERCWVRTLLTFKNAQGEGCESSFTWGKMSTIARETAPRVALRDCPEAVGGRSVCLWFWQPGNACSKARIFAECCCWSPAEDVTRKEFSAFIDMKRCKHCSHKISPWEYLKPPEDLFCQFLESTECLIAALHPECFRGSWRSAAAVSHDFILVEGDGQHPWQVRICSWQHPALNTIFKGIKVYHTLRQQVLWPLLFKGLKNNK